MATQSTTDQGDSTKTEVTVPRALDATFQQFDSLPDSAYVQLRTVVAVTSTSPATVYRMVERGTLPKPKKVSARASRWNVGELRSSLAAL